MKMENESGIICRLIPISPKSVIEREIVRRLAHPLRLSSSRLEPSGKCAGLITESFKHNFHNVMTWGALTIEQKDGYFDEFKKNCIWDENDVDIRLGWNIQAATKYSSFMHNMKKHKGRRKPNFLLDDAWVYLLEQWDDPKVKTRSAIMKANRGRASPHTGGSRSFANTADLLRKEQVVTPHLLFVHTHTSKNDGKTYISSKALSVEEAYQVEIAAQKKANEENGTPIDENKAYLIAAGGIKKSGMFGLGSEKIVQYGSSSSSSDRSQSGSSRTMQEKIDQLNDTILTERAEREAERLLRDQEMQVMQQQISQMHAMFQGFTNATKKCAPQGSVDGDNHSLDLD